MTLIDLILDQYERSVKWNGDYSGQSSFRIEEKHYTIVGRNDLVQEAKILEEEQLLKIRWVKGYYNVDIEKVEYPLIHIDIFYQKAHRTPKFQSMKQKLDMVNIFYERIKSPWIRSYTEEEVFPRLQKGTDKSSYEELYKLYQCFEGLDQLETPIFKRVFSKRYLKNSKIFEKELQGKIIGIARKYHEAMEDAMGDNEVLSQLYIEEYAQELSIKGNLLMELLGRKIDTGAFCFGTVLNTQTIKNAIILDNPHITKVITIENKANYVAQAYEEGTLILFSHGYFTPLEREFLIRLREKLAGQKVSYLHSGDLDYGGIRIFQYIRKRIFPELQPIHMDQETFQKYIDYGEPIESGPKEKITGINEPLLQPVIDCIMETGLVIEQEAFL